MKFSFTVFQRFSFPFSNDFLVCLAVWFFWFHLKRLSIILVSEFIFMAFINFWWKTNKQTNKTERLWGERLDRSCLRSWYETVSHFILGWTNMKDSILRMNFILFANWEEKSCFFDSRKFRNREPVIFVEWKASTVTVLAFFVQHEGSVTSNRNNWATYTAKGGCWSFDLISA